MARKGTKFVEKFPDVAKMLHPTKNEDVDVSNLSKTSEVILWWVCPETKIEYQRSVKNQVRAGAVSPMQNGSYFDKNKDSLAAVYPELAKQWSEKNGDLTPWDVSSHSNKAVWWECPVTQEVWKTDPNHRVRSKDFKSPFVTGKKVLVGYNDLKSQYPNVINEWHPDRNGDLKPEMVTAGSDKKVWWICLETGAPYQATVNKKVAGTKSPYVANKKVLAGYNDLASQAPLEVVGQFSEELNKVSANEVIVSSAKKYKWICPTYGLVFEDEVRARVKHILSPFEMGTKVIPGVNDLATQNPDLSAQWDFERNKTLPSETFPYSNKKVFWRCPVTNKSWESAPSTRQKSNDLLSPFVKNLKVIPGVNDLATTHPFIAKSWHYKKNDGLLPQDVTAVNRSKVWWLCSESGYPWKAEIRSRVSQGVGSPYQSGKRVAPGYNDIASTHKELCKQWNYTKNGDLTPEMFTAGTNTRVWWICEENHEWLASISNRTRTSNATNCPVCSLSGTSNKEKELFNYICSVTPIPIKIISNDRSVLSDNRGKLGGTEIDILIPALNLGFEFNGHYWHDENEDFAETGIGKPVGYHAAKTKAAEQNGVKLIHVWESEWDMNNDAVKEKVKNFITLAVNRNIYGEK